MVTSPPTVELTAAALSAAIDLVANFVETCDPDRYTGEDAAKMVVTFAKAKRSVTAGQLLFARRVQKTKLHEQKGHKEVGSWLAGVTGEPVGQATSDMVAAQMIEAHPEVQEAFKKGNLSRAQAREIASVADHSPNEAADLIEDAQKLTFG